MIEIRPNADLKKTIKSLDKIKKASPKMIRAMIGRVCVDSKKGVRKSFKSMMTSRTGETLKSLKHKARKDGSGVVYFAKGKSAYPNVFGATILPKNGDYLYFTGDDGQLRKMESVTIPQKDFFFPEMEKYFSSDRPNKVMQEKLDKELEKEWNKQ